MAAVLCRSIGQACHGVGSFMSHVLCLPCRACGMGCELANDICTSPFFPYLGLTFLLNLPPIVKTAGILDDFDGTAWCSRGSRWLLTNSVLCAIHMVASLYIVHKIRHEPPKNTNSTNAPTEAPVMAAVVTGKEEVDKNNGKVEDGTYYAVASPASSVSSDDEDEMVTQPLSMARIKDVLCEDPGMAIYLLVIFFWFIWMCVGVNKSLELGEECGDTQPVIEIALICGWLYFALVGIAFGCSLCCL